MSLSSTSGREAFSISLLLVEWALVSISPKLYAGQPWRSSAHLLTNDIQRYAQIAFDDQFIMDMTADKTVGQCPHNLVAEPAEVEMHDVFPGVTMTRCKKCGKTVYQYPGRKEKKFCSDACRNKWWSEHQSEIKRKSMLEFTCPNCGKPFYAYEYRKRKYCSHACYIEHRFGEGSCD